MMIVDCGENTVATATRKIVSVDPLRLDEVIASDEVGWGSTRVDGAFKDWLKSFLGERFKHSEECGEVWTILKQWEQEKAWFEGLCGSTFRAADAR